MKKQHKLPPFVPITKQMMETPAWRAMSHGARWLYVALRGRYNHITKNNGKIWLPRREGMAQLGSGSSQISRWYREIQYYGFAVMTEGGCLGIDGKGRQKWSRKPDQI
jgi:hypothetical protein